MNVLLYVVVVPQTAPQGCRKQLLGKQRVALDRSGGIFMVPKHWGG